MITYEHKVKLSSVVVKLDGRIVGRIRKVEGGWSYFPKWQSEGGEVFTTLRECQKSLES